MSEIQNCNERFMFSLIIKKVTFSFIQDKIPVQRETHSFSHYSNSSRYLPFSISFWKCFVLWIIHITIMLIIVLMNLLLWLFWLPGDGTYESQTLGSSAAHPALCLQASYAAVTETDGLEWRSEERPWGFWNVTITSLGHTPCTDGILFPYGSTNVPLEKWFSCH